MNKTSCAISFGRNAIAIKDDIASITATDIQSFSDLNDLEMMVAFNQKPYATYENNFWLLDGNYKFKPSTAVHVGYMSASLTDVSGNDTGSPGLTITFNSVHSNSNLILRFAQYSNDYASGITIAYYNSSDVLIRTDNYTPTTTYFETGQAVSNFKKIIITFTVSNKPYRYFRLMSIDFDEAVLFSGTEVKEARLMEDINPLSTELSINTLDLTLFSADGDFSIVAPAGFYANLQYKEPLDAYEQINDSVIYIGRFYLDKWESQSENIARFETSDAIGLLDASIYDGLMPNTSYTNVIADIMANTGLEYEFDASFTATTKYAYGWINKCTHREALQQFAIDIGAYITCARSKKIRILPLELASGLSTYDYTLTATSKGISSPLTLRPLVTGVEVTSHLYNTDEVEESLIKVSLPTGNHRIFFGLDVPVWDSFTVTGATNISSGDWRGTYIDINVAVAGVVEILGAKYRDLQKVHSEYNGSLPANTPSNIVQIADATLITSFIHTDYIHADTVVARIYDYYSQRYLQKTKLFAIPIAPGDSVLINSQSGSQIKGIVEKMETNLTGGFVSNVEIVGVIA